MRPLITCFTALFIAFILGGLLPEAYAQTGINYQAVARNGSGDVMKNETISVRFTVNDGTSSQVYQEVHNGVTTNDYGLFTLVVGSKNSTTFNSVDWSSGDHELVVDIDPDNGTNWTNMGTKALQSVPYSLHTDMELGALNNVNTGNVNNDQLIKWDGSNWVPTSSIWSTSGSDAYYNNGNVGIGTSSPQAPLDIAGGNWDLNSSEGDLRIGGSQNRLKVSMSTGGGGAGHARINAFGYDPEVRLGGTGDDVLRVDSQAVAIGDYVLNPNPIPDELHVVQRDGLGGPSTAIRIEKGSTYSSGARNYWGIGLGRSTDNFKFYFNGGTAKADISSSDGSYNQLSDRQVKEGIETPNDVLGKVMKLNPKRYFYKSDKERNHKSYGFIAQEVNNLFPSFVSDMEGDLKGIAYDNFAVLAIQATQEQQEQLREQQEQIDELKQENQELREKVNEVENLKQRLRELEAVVKE